MRDILKLFLYICLFEDPLQSQVSLETLIWHDWYGLIWRSQLETILWRTQGGYTIWCTSNFSKVSGVTFLRWCCPNWGPQDALFANWIPYIPQQGSRWLVFQIFYLWFEVCRPEDSNGVSPWTPLQVTHDGYFHCGPHLYVWGQYVSYLQHIRTWI